MVSSTFGGFSVPFFLGLPAPTVTARAQTIARVKTTLKRLGSSRRIDLPPCIPIGENPLRRDPRTGARRWPH
jgi:hypothetical protein